jgi:Tfp pilus assembly protein PilF
MVFILVLFLDFGWGGPPNPIDLAAAKAAMASKEYDKVAELISPNLDVANKEAFLILTKAYIEQSNLPMAQKTLATGRSKFPEDPEFPTELGKVYLGLNKDREAKTILKEVIEAHPKYEPAYLAMADLYEKKKNRYELRLIYQDLVQHITPRPEYLTKLCDLSTQEGLYDLSFKYCVDGIKKNPREPLNYVNLANSYKETGNTSEANANYKKAADSFSKSELSQFAYAQFLEEQKKFVDSYKYFKRATEADPKSVRAWMGFGFSAIEIQKFQESLIAFERVCEGDRNGVKQARKAASVIKTLNQPQWMKKFEELIRKCEELTPGKRFL